MPLEQILLIVALVAVPLIQYLRRAQQLENGSAQAEDPQRSAGRATVRVLPTALAHPPARDAIVVPEGMAQRNETPAVTPATFRSTRRLTGHSLRDPLDLRRAIVLMTVLEPCRALRPHDSSERGERL